MRAPTKLRELLHQPHIVVAPGCYDALSAKLIEHAGFECAYMSGGSFAATYLGAPDFALTTMTELTAAARGISAAVSIPVIGDMETGFGSVLSVRRATREYESTGLAGAHIEDQTAAKHCGHSDGKTLVTVEEMVTKLEAAISARQDPDFVIIARCDAIAVEGLASALHRGRRYVEAGADVVYIEAPRNVDEIRAIAGAFRNIPVLLGQPENGVTPLLPPAELEAIGIRIVTHPRSIRLAMAHAALEVLTELKTYGVTTGCTDQLMPNDVFQGILGTPAAAEMLAAVEH